MILLHDTHEVFGLGLLQHTQRPNHICVQEGLQAWESVLHCSVNLCSKNNIQGSSGEERREGRAEKSTKVALSTWTSSQHLAVELFRFTGLEVQSRKGQDEVTYLRGAVVLTVCCEVLVKETQWQRTL